MVVPRTPASASSWLVSAFTEGQAKICSRPPSHPAILPTKLILLRRKFLQGRLFTVPHRCQGGYRNSWGALSYFRILNRSGVSTRVDPSSPAHPFRAFWRAWSHHTPFSLQDFDIGKVYKKKITLINATYTINYCKLVGVEEDLKDFIHIE